MWSAHTASTTCRKKKGEGERRGGRRKGWRREGGEGKEQEEEEEEGIGRKEEGKRGRWGEKRRRGKMNSKFV